jgi:hypothetical protein
MLFMIGKINKMRPDIASYYDLKHENLKLLNYFHGISATAMLLPAWLINPLQNFLLPFPDKINISQAIAFLVSFGAIGFFPWKRVGRDVNEFEKGSLLPPAYIGMYAFLRIAFLIIYEWFFRGLLLLTFIAWFGMGWGIVINILLYTIMHAHKSKKEMIGCIPFGFFLCVFTLWWQSVWPAIIFHLQLAIVNEWPPLQKFFQPQKQTAL